MQQNKLSVHEAMQKARAHHQGGRLKQAESILRKVLEVEPTHADALFLSGMACFKMGDGESAVGFLNKAVRVCPSNPFYYQHLGIVLHALGKLDQAVASFLKALSIKPDFAIAHSNLGNAQKAQGRIVEAIASFRRALSFNPGLAEAHYNLGVIFQELNKFDYAAASYQSALSIRPDFAQAHSNLGNVLKEQGQLDGAVASINRALSINPEFAVAHNNLGNVLKELGRLDEAVASFRRALSISPGLLEARTNLGITLRDQGRLDEAMMTFEQGLLLHQDCALLYSLSIHTLSLTAEDQGARTFELSRRFGEWLESTLSRMPNLNDPTPHKRLKVGYVSGDFRLHSVANFIEPVLANHDRQSLEIFCYYNHRKIDVVTRRMMTYADHWRSIEGIPDEAVANMIQQDAIDILVDLGGHTADNRLAVFARKPAPVQVTWIGHPGTSGLTAMDYRLTDRHVDPPGWNEQYHTETLVRLSASNCFQPEAELPEIEPLPALKNGYVTFASFHDPGKITPPTIELWSIVLSAVPGSRLLLCPDGSRNQLTEQFLACGIRADRLIFSCKLPIRKYLALHNAVDIALDTIPRNGGTISRHSLWMGVPVLTLAGRSSVSRIGLSLMSHVGMESFVAQNAEEYVNIALKWTGDLVELARVRKVLRERMRQAPTSNAKLITAELEVAYRQMWGKWCEQQRSMRC